MVKAMRKGFKNKVDKLDTAVEKIEYSLDNIVDYIIRDDRNRACTEALKSLGYAFKVQRLLEKMPSPQTVTEQVYYASIGLDKRSGRIHKQMAKFGDTLEELSNVQYNK